MASKTLICALTCYSLFIWLILFVIGLIAFIGGNNQKGGDIESVQNELWSMRILKYDWKYYGHESDSVVFPLR